MLENHPRNPFLILVFTALGMFMRYSFFSVVSIFTRNKPKKMQYYSEGFHQVVYNILLTLVIIIACVLYMVHDALH